MWSILFPALDSQANSQSCSPGSTKTIPEEFTREQALCVCKYVRTHRLDSDALNNTSYNGNIELIKKGAIPINENFDFKNLEKPFKFEQQSLFD